MKGFFVPYLTSPGVETPLPLARFLPPLPAGVITQWLNENLEPGSFVIDPLGSTPSLALEAARAGFRVLGVYNNPIISFMLEILARAPQPGDFQSAFAELAEARRGEDRLESHLKALYETECASCSGKIQASAFLWRKGETQPFARLYRCPMCEKEEEQPVSPADLARLALPGSPALLRARALERVCMSGDPARLGVEEALEVFLPRALYFLTTLINKIEGLSLPPERKNLLVALALSTCDEATSLWQHPSGRSRPRQLSLPTQFKENNLWMAMEAAIPAWTCEDRAIPVSSFSGELPQPGTISIFHGRLKSLTLPVGLSPQAAVAVVPRPNQAFWTLSAIWSGWMWGREAVRPLHSALERRRYDWLWHTNAIHQVLTTLNSAARTPLPFFTLIPEMVPGFLSALMIGAQAAGLEIKSAALQPGDGILQAEWLTNPAPGQSQTKANIESISQQAISQVLVERSEPTPHLPLFTAALIDLVRNKALPVNIPQVPTEFFTRFQATMQHVFLNPKNIKRQESRTQSVESGWWWLMDPPPNLPLPLTDRVEMETVRYLQKNPGHTFFEIESILNQLFPGLLTPTHELVRVCLQSYGDSSSSLPERWQLHPQEEPPARRHDLAVVRKGIESLGATLGFSCQGDNPVVWVDQNGASQYCLFLQASAIISRYMLNEQPLPPERCIIVLPGSRANLVAFKLRLDMRLNSARQGGWRFLKFRMLRQLQERPRLTINQFEELADSDPPQWEETAIQMSFFEKAKEEQEE